MSLPISSRNNPVFQRLRRLSGEARERSRENRTLLEGAHLVGAWLDRDLPLDALVVDAAALAQPAVARVLDAAQARGLSPVLLDHALMQQLSSLDSPSKVIAEITPIAARPEAVCGQDFIVLDALQDPGNVGALLRTCAAAGVGHVIAGPGTAAFWSPKVLRAAMGAHALLNLLSVDDLPAMLPGLGVPLYGTSSHASTFLHDLVLPQPCAWVFGHEGRGISSEVMALLAVEVAIDQALDVESLNVAAAAAVCLFETRRQRVVARTR
jgi:TrmH family RNA methyltransferase